MITLLRKIRKNLLSKSNFYSYLLYAIGEIALVVIGILLALQINNWNEQRKNRAAELKALNDLQQEFLATKALLLDKKEKLQFGTQFLDHYIQKMVAGEATMEDYVDFYNKMRGRKLGIGTTDPPLGVLNSLLNSGDINLIRNDSLKVLLTSWKDVFMDFREDEAHNLDRMLSSNNYRDDQVPRLFHRNQRIQYKHYPEPLLEEKVQKLLNDFKYQNRVIRIGGTLKNLLHSALDDLLSQVDQIIEWIEAAKAS